MKVDLYNESKKTRVVELRDFYTSGVLLGHSTNFAHQCQSIHHRWLFVNGAWDFKYFKGGLWEELRFWRLKDEGIQKRVEIRWMALSK